MPATEPQFPVGQQKMNRDPETHLNKNFTFDSFVPGDSNRFARTVALAVAEGSGQDFNRCVSMADRAWAKPTC